MSIDKATFKQAMAKFATGVTVVTTHHEGQDHGMTANAFCSVSLEPRLVLVSIAKQLYTHDQIAKSGIFAVNILALHQMEWGDRFAGRYPNLTDRFEGMEVERAPSGCPILPDSLAWVDCKLRHAYEGGDHTIFVGEVIGGGVSTGEAAPLLYYDARWSQLDKEGPSAGSSWPNEKSTPSNG